MTAPPTGPQPPRDSADEVDSDASSESPPSTTRRVLRGLLELVVMLVVAAVAVTVVGRLRAPDLPDGAPDFTLDDLDGREWQLSELRGQPVVLNFWATWCGPCKVEIPAFSAFAEDNPDVVVLGLATDGKEAELRAASKQLGISYPVIRADRETVAAYDVSTLPTTVIIDVDGRVHTAHTGIMLGPQLDLAVSGAR